MVSVMAKVIKLDTSSSEPSHSRLEAAFSPGDFQSVGQKGYKTTTTSATASAEEVPADNPEESNKAEGVYACPQDGCVRIFQRVSALEKHLSLEKCTQSLEKTYPYRSSQNGLQGSFEEGVGALQTLKTSTLSQDYPAAVAKEGWALRAAKKAYRFQR
ncbi:hypothetical protein OS493_011473 [Desmophyllum pertusum]|uniref:C2H2-type domain-containing protein n=1 Tax=Desmophyllum pertusum TaxID=174260 RepID=A0A9W9YQM9_9CNID|nr:hypothetical protein OS493_011473 [Desmophyllum pertusum]